MFVIPQKMRGAFVKVVTADCYQVSSLMAASFHYNTFPSQLIPYEGLSGNERLSLPEEACMLSVASFLPPGPLTCRHPWIRGISL